MENNSEVLSGLVVKRIRDGRCRYDPQVKQELVCRALQPGVSVAKLAMQHGVNANLLRKWITQRQSRNAIAVQQAASEVAPQNSAAFLAVQLSGAPNARVAVPTKTSAVDSPAGSTAQRSGSRSWEVGQLSGLARFKPVLVLAGHLIHFRSISDVVFAAADIDCLCRYSALINPASNGDRSNTNT
jgi:transposase